MVRKDAMRVGPCKENGLQPLFPSWRFITRQWLALGLGETRNLLVKCIKGVSDPYYFEIQKCPLNYMHG